MPTQKPTEREVDFRDLKDATSTEIGYEGAHLQTAMYHNVNEFGQQTDIFVADASGGKGPNIIYTPSHNQFMTEHVMRSASVFATHSHAKVIYPVPHVLEEWETTKDDRETPRQAFSAMMGNFKPIGRTILHAINQEIGIEDRQEFQLVGRSYGNNLALGIAQAAADDDFEKNVQIGGVSLIEAVNPFRKLSPIELAKLLGRLAKGGLEDKWRELYFKENKMIRGGEIGSDNVELREQTKGDIRLIGRQILYVYAAGAGVRVGLVDGIVELIKNHSIQGPVKILRAVNSTVSPEKDSLDLAEKIIDEGGDAEVINLVQGKGDDTPLGHHLQDSHLRQAKVALAA